MMLAEQRAHLTDLLLQLMEQRDIRAKEIAKRMVCSIVVYLLFDAKCCEHLKGVWVNEKKIARYGNSQ